MRLIREEGGGDEEELKRTTIFLPGGQSCSRIFLLYNPKAKRREGLSTNTASTFSN